MQVLWKGVKEIEELVQIRNKEAVCTSLEVAEHFRKQHSKVVRSIENIIEGLAKNGDTEQMFWKSSYIEEQNNQEYVMYVMNREGFSLLVMGFTGDKAFAWKLKYIKAFKTMEKVLSDLQSAERAEARKQGKLTRKAETDVLKELVEYAEAHGSKNAQRLYVIYTKLANKTVGIESRELATAEQLNTLEIVERIILNAVKDGMRRKMEYHKIYLFTKEKLMIFQQVAYLA